jgi:hypothetical protein
VADEPQPTQHGTELRVSRHSSGLSIAGTGDFNGDGYTDLLWRDTAE